MFYSQFILAKKGPLGTIWIAAHLERKLRKNQVADTDIGVSVDSILFPEVPIALRLSSHLLLGVVRIYSRKVNYLFNDCSEALLKIKQAFRSTAVDLPPEESTAPYHSITLPETFDLDDFELPDSEFFQGNYVDHHVSSKEQITLQDTMDGVVYSTSKFGLDERFGDGDTSQIGLDLDEDLFSEKVAASGNAGLPGSEEGSNPHAAGQNNLVFANMDVDEYQGTEERNYETTDTMPIAGSGDQIDDTPVILSRHSIESQIPSSPGLTELANEPDVKDVAAFNLAKRTLLPDSVDVMMSDVPCKHHLEADCHNSTDLVAKENLGNHSSRPDLYCNGVLNDKSSDTVLGMPTGENVSLAGFPEVSPVKQQGDSVFTSQAADLSASDVPGSMSSPTSVLAEQLKPVSPVSECSDRIIAATDTHEKVETSQNGGFINKEPNVSSVDQSQMGGVEPQGASLDCAAASTGSFETSTLEEHITKQNCSIESVTRTNLSSDCLPEDKSGNNHDSHRETSESEALRNVCIVGDVNSSCLSNNTVMSSDGCLLGSASRDELENDRTTYKLEPQGPKIIETVCSDEIPCTHSHVLQACNSKMSESNIQPLAEQNSKFGSEASDISFRGDGISLAGAEEAFQATEVQGELSHTNDGPNCPDQGLEANKITKNILSEDMMTDLKKSDDHQENIILSDTQFKTLNCDISSDLPAPEKLLSAPEEVADLPNNLIAEPTPENKAREAVRGDGFKEILSGQKRRFMETTPVLQSQDSDKLSGARQFERTVDGVPEDDDLLSSILVGRRSSAFKMKPTPPPPEVVSSKRPRLTPRVNVSKRKVLLDDIMVLHGDTIRQQLTSTEGIRRIRKKAPCTRPEIWMIQNILLEEEVFSEPILTGMSTELICVHNQTYDLNECKVSPEDAIHTSLEVLKDTEPSGSIDVTKKTSNEESIGLVVVSDHGGQPTETFVQTQNKENLDPSVESFSGQPAETSLQNQNQQNLEPSVYSFGCDTQFQTESLINTPLHESLTDGELVKMAELNMEKGNDGIADVSDKSATTGDELFPPVGPPSGDNCSMSVDTVTFSPFINKNNGSEVTLQNDELCLSPDQKIDNQSVVKDGFILTTDDGKVDDSKEVAKANEDNFISIEDACRESNASSLEGAEGTGAVDVFAPKFHVCQLSPGEYTSTTATTTVLDLVETRAELVTASSTLPENSSASLLNGYPETGVQNGVVDITNVQATELITGNKVGIVNEDEVVAGKLISDEEDPPSKPLCSEEHQHDSSYSPKVNVNMKDVSSTEKENPCCLESELSSMDVEVTALDNAATRDPWDHSDIIVGNDTEFLNVDDDEVAEEEDNSMPSTEDAQIFENTGWSSRTRAVAKYLQILFHKEAGHGRKDVPLDNLLAGKTRKEASRMFFETLVLKTRDYIHVEQENPFDNVHIKPRVKLMKSDL